MTKDEALKLALEALKKLRAYPETIEYMKQQDAIIAIKEALALPQRTWVGLTDEEIDLVCVGLWSGGWRKKAMQDFAKAIEAKLKERNT